MRIALVFSISILMGSMLFAQPPVQHKEFFDFNQHISISVKPSSQAYRLGEPIYLEVWFENTSPNQDTYRFYLWENSFEQWTVNAELQDGQVPFETFAYKRWKYEQRTIREPREAHSREIALAYGETFSFRLRIDQYNEFNQIGFYNIAAEFYPLSIYRNDYVLPVKGTLVEIRENFSSLDARLNSEGEDVFLFQRDQDNLPQFTSDGASYADSTTLDPQTSKWSPTPGETISRLLRAFQLKRWEAYLSYLQVEALMTNSYRSTDFYERMLTANAIERRVIMSEFRNFLISSSDYDITTSEILQAVTVGNQARVEVLITSEEFYQRFREVFNPLTGQLENQWTDLVSDIPITRSRIFTYELEQVENAWKVVAIEVQLFDGDIAELRRRYALTPQVSDTNQTPEFIEKILFEFNQSEVAQEYESVLSELADFMRVRPYVGLRLVGFTDDVGSQDYNQTLSAARVLAVRNFLIARGVNITRIETLARGESNPLNLNRNEEERRENRRVEVYFID